MIRNTIKLYLILFTSFLFAQSANFDSNIEIKTSVDTTEVKIGEEVNFKISITSKNRYNIRFDENPNFLPFEVINSYPNDTVLDSSAILKKYSLINFEPGEFWIPPQKIYFNQSIKFSDSMLVTIKDVEVDTLKQNLFDIKPIIPVKRNFQNLIISLIFVLVFLSLGYLAYRYLLTNKKRSLKKQFKSLYEIANEKLTKLSNLDPNSQIEFKEYYSILIDIFREYLEFQVDIPAMESTSQQLLLRINMLKDSHDFNFEKKQIDRLEVLFTKSDLIKFAKSLPTKNDLNSDLTTIKDFIDSTEKIYSEKNDMIEEQDDIDINRSTIDYIKIVLKYSFVIISTILILSVLIFGYYPVRDTLLLNPTKQMIGKEWYLSQYGSPPVELNTPNILERSNDSIHKQKFIMGDLNEKFYISLEFNDVAQTDSPINLNILKNDLVSQFQNLGSKNILVKDGDFKIKSGDTGLRLFGSLDIELNNNLHRSNFTSIILPYEKKTIKLIIVYKENDRYASDIESKILESFNIIKEL